MRIGLVGFLLMSCSGSGPVERPDPEICDDGIDNNDDGLIDCDDQGSCGGLVCRDTDDTETGVEPEAVEIIYDDEACCDFQYSCPAADKSLGRFSIINRSTELDAFIDISCDLVGPSLAPIEFQVVGSTQPSVPFLIDADLYAETSAEIEVFFACKPGLNVDFNTVCTVTVENDEDEFELLIPVAAQATNN